MLSFFYTGVNEVGMKLVETWECFESREFKNGVDIHIKSKGLNAHLDLS